MSSSTSRSTTTVAILGCVSVIAALTALRMISTKSSKSKDLDEIEEIDEKDTIKAEDVVKIFDSLFMNMQAVVAQLSGQIQQIQASGQMIPEAQLRQLLKSEFERALEMKQEKIFEEHGVDEDCIREATQEFLSKPDEFPKVKKSVERFQKLYENVSGESVTGTSDGGKDAGPELTKEALLNAAEIYFDALTAAMGNIVTKFKDEGKNLSDPSVAQQLHMQFASVANDAGEEALKNLDITIGGFRGAIEKYSSNPEVGRMLSALQMKQHKELMDMGVPPM